LHESFPPAILPPALRSVFIEVVKFASRCRGLPVVLVQREEIRELRIALITPGRYPPDFGGAELRLHRTFLRLRKRYPVEVRVLALAGESTAPGWSELDGIPVYRVSANPSFPSSFYLAGAHLLSERRRGIDLVYTISTGRLAYSAGLWTRAVGRPLVAEFANNNIEESPQRRMMAGLLARSSALAIAISQPVADQFRRLGVGDDRMWVRPNPVDTARFHWPSAKQRAAGRQRFGAADETILHALVGVLSERKNHIVGIEAIERLPNPHRLIIAGPVFRKEPEYAREIADRIRSSSAYARITFIPEFVPDVEELMYAIDCLWMPSKEEALGNVMLEALCCGAPCIISNRLGLDEHITDMQNGLKAEPTADGWSSAVLSLAGLISDTNARRALSVRSCAAYDASVIDAEHFRRLSSVCSGQGRSSK
jgi:glycosyltransferase involved in cell wall biosynthesis